VSKELSYHQQTQRDNIKSVEGIWDLHDIDFDERIEFIDGEVEYVLSMLLSPEEFDRYTGEVVIGYVPFDTEVATARLTVYVTPGRYMISGNSIDYSERIYINGEHRLDVGSPGLTQRDSVPGKRYMKFEVDASGGVIEIVRQSSNFVHKENSAYAGFWIGTTENMRQIIALQEMPAAVITGIFLALFLMHLIAWLLFRGYRSNLWFSLLCLVGFVTSGLTGRGIAFSLFPELSWEFAYSVGSAGQAVAGLLILLLLHDEFYGLVQKWAMRIFAALCVAFSVFFLLADTVLVSHTTIGAEILFLLTIVYLAARFGWLLRSKHWRDGLRTEHMLTIIGAVTVMVTLLHDTLYYNGIHILSYEIADVGVVTFVLFQTAAMFYGTMRRYAEARQESAAAKLEAEKLAEKTEFYRKMSHDLRTPLTIVSTNIQTAQRRPEEAFELLADSQAEIMRMAGMISDALKDGEKGAGE
jgi:hypothetical protein